MPQVEKLYDIAARLKRGDVGATGGVCAEEDLLRPLLEEREKVRAAFDLVQLVDFR